MKRIILALALLMASGVGASAQTTDTRAQLQSQINSYIKANGVGAISGPILNVILNNMVSAEVTQADTSNTLNGSGIPVANGASSPLTFTPPASGIMAWLASPSSANLLAAMTTKTGTGNVVFSISPALTGTPTAPTQTTSDTSTAIATDGFVNANLIVALPNLTTSQLYGGTGGGGVAQHFPAGSGVETALQVAIGNAGSPVLLNGAGG